MIEQKYKGILTVEKRRAPYLKKAWYRNPTNFYWRDGRHNEKFVEKMDKFAADVASLDVGCYLKIIPDS